MNYCYKNYNYYNAGDEIKETLMQIVNIQKKAVHEELGEQMCDFNTLGYCSAQDDYNTRPLQIYTINDKAWFCPVDGAEGTCADTGVGMSCVFRVEKVEGDTATFRTLTVEELPGGKVYHSTNSFITIKLSSVAAIRCLGDTHIDLCTR